MDRWKKISGVARKAISVRSHLRYLEEEIDAVFMEFGRKRAIVPPLSLVPVNFTDDGRPMVSNSELVGWEKLGWKVRGGLEAGNALSVSAAAFSIAGRMERAMGCLDMMSKWAAWPDSRSMAAIVKGLVFKGNDVDLGWDLAVKYSIIESCCVEMKICPPGMEHVARGEARLLDGQVGSVLMRGWARRRDLDSAQWFLDEVLNRKPTLEEMTSLLDLHIRMENSEDALATVKRMREMGLEADQRVYELILRMCERLKRLGMADTIWREMKETGIDPDLHCYVTYMRCASRVGDRRRVREIWYEATDRNIFSARETQLLEQLMEDAAIGKEIAKP